MGFEFITKNALEGVKMALNGEGVTIKDRDPPVPYMIYQIWMPSIATPTH